MLLPPNFWTRNMRSSCATPRLHSGHNCICPMYVYYGSLAIRSAGWEWLSRLAGVSVGRARFPSNGFRLRMVSQRGTSQASSVKPAGELCWFEHSASCCCRAKPGSPCCRFAETFRRPSVAAARQPRIVFAFEQPLRIKTSPLLTTAFLLLKSARCLLLSWPDRFPSSCNGGPAHSSTSRLQCSGLLFDSRDLEALRQLPRARCSNLRDLALMSVGSRNPGC